MCMLGDAINVETYKTKHTLIQKNPMTGNFLCTPLNANVQNIKEHFYFAQDKAGASEIAQTMDHFEDTKIIKVDFKPNLKYLGTKLMLPHVGKRS